MSKLKFIFAILIMALISPVTFAQEEPSTYDVPMSDSDSESGEAPIELPEYGNRSLTPWIICHISHDGITLSGIDLSDTVNIYELSSRNGVTVFSTTEEIEFIDYIYSGIKGNYIIRLYTQYLDIYGEIWII